MPPVIQPGEPVGDGEALQLALALALPHAGHQVLEHLRQLAHLAPTARRELDRVVPGGPWPPRWRDVGAGVRAASPRSWPALPPQGARPARGPRRLPRRPDGTPPPVACPPPPPSGARAPAAGSR